MRDVFISTTLVETARKNLEELVRSCERTAYPREERKTDDSGIPHSAWCLLCTSAVAAPWIIVLSRDGTDMAAFPACEEHKDTPVTVNVSAW